MDKRQAKALVYALEALRLELRASAAMVFRSQSVGDWLDVADRAARKALAIVDGDATPQDYRPLMPADEQAEHLASFEALTREGPHAGC